MDFSAEQKKYIIERIKYAYQKGFYEGMTNGVILGIVGGFAIFNVWGDVIVKGFAA